MSVHRYCTVCDTNVGVTSDPHKDWCPRAGRVRSHAMSADLYDYVVRLEFENEQLREFIKDRADDAMRKALSHISESGK